MPKRLIYLVSDAGYFLAHRAALARAAAEEGWQVEVATAPDPRQEEIAALGFGVHSIPFRRHGLNPLAELRVLLAIFALYRRLKPDLVHHVTLKAVLLGGLAARMARVPAKVHSITGVGHVFTERGLGWRALQAAIRLTLAFITPASARIITEHAADLQTVAASDRTASRGRVILGSGVDLALFAQAPLPPQPPFRVLLASRLIEKKGIADYAKAGALLRERGLAVECLLAGAPDEGAPGAITRERLEAWDRAGDLIWLGRRSDMPDLMASCHAVALPSRYGEGVPRCLIEGAAAGRALIASDLPGCQEIVKEGGNGRLVPQGDWQALAAAIADLAAQPQKVEAMGAASRRLAEETFGNEKVSSETLAVYAEISPPDS